jgi:hypothetical protein
LEAAESGAIHRPALRNTPSFPLSLVILSEVKNLLVGEAVTLLFEIREDRLGEYYRLITLWRATEQERRWYEANA